jgi:enoyl-CoA hydratase
VSTQAVRTERDGDVAILTLDRPPMNALDAGSCDAIRGAIAAVVADEGVRAVVLTGAGKAFSAGVDLQIIPELDTAGQDVLLDALNAMVRDLYGAPLPVIAAVNGHAIAGGLVLAVCADHRVVGHDGRHGLTEVAVGVRFPLATREAVQAELGPAAVRRIVFGGALLTSTEALELGAYDEIADDPLARALEVAHTLARHPPAMYGDIKAAIRGETLERMAHALNGGEPLKGTWLSDEMRELARARLAR